MESNPASPPASKQKTARASHAVTLWLLVIAGVLAVLFFQTRGTGALEYNVLIDVQGGQVGDSVIVDGKAMAQLIDGKDSGLSGTIARLKLANGKHSVQIGRANGSSASKELDVQGKEYLKFDLAAPPK